MADPIDFMIALAPIFAKLPPEDARKIGLAMDCAVAYGACYEISGLAPGMDPAEFRRLYEAKVAQLLTGQ